jgi:hypothetical protein
MAVERPMPVTVFGVFNIIIASYKLTVKVSELVKRITNFEMLNLFKESGFLLLLTIVITGLLIWLFVLGTGLLTMKRWARRGCCMYALAQILLIVIMLVISTFALAFHRTSAATTQTLHDFFIICEFQLDNLIYPVLLLIFMQTADVKKAFAAIEKTKAGYRFPVSP